MPEEPVTFEEMLNTRGVRLNRPGQHEVGLNAHDALNAIAVLETDGRLVLGGDMYFLRDGRIEPAYAGWHVKRQPNENAFAFAKRSCEEAREYILQLPLPTNDTRLFVFVLQRDQ